MSLLSGNVNRASLQPFNLRGGLSGGWHLHLNRECRLEGCYCLKLRGDVLESLSSRAIAKSTLEPEGESHADLAKPVSPSFAMNIPLSIFLPCFLTNIHPLYFLRDDATGPETFNLPNDKP